MGQVAARFAQLDQGFQALAAQGHFFFGQHRVVQTEFFHQGFFFGLADFHAERFDFFCGGGHFGAGDFHFCVGFKVGVDVGEIGIVQLFTL